MDRALRVKAPEAWAGALKAGVAINTNRLKASPRQVAASWLKERRLWFMVRMAREQ
jgi:hypothetical protein